MRKETTLCLICLIAADVSKSLVDINMFTNTYISKSKANHYPK